MIFRCRIKGCLYDAFGRVRDSAGCENATYKLSPAVALWFPHQGRVRHISLVFGAMWDSTMLTAPCIG